MFLSFASLVWCCNGILIPSCCDFLISGVSAKLFKPRWSVLPQVTFLHLFECLMLQPADWRSLEAPMCSRCHVQYCETMLRVSSQWFSRAELHKQCWIWTVRICVRIYCHYWWNWKWILHGIVPLLQCAQNNKTTYAPLKTLFVSPSQTCWHREIASMSSAHHLLQVTHVFLGKCLLKKHGYDSVLLYGSVQKWSRVLWLSNEMVWSLSGLNTTFYFINIFFRLLFKFVHNVQCKDLHQHFGKQLGTECTLRNSRESMYFDKQ